MLYINLNYIDHFANFLFQKYRWRNSGKMIRNIISQILIGKEIYQEITIIITISNLFYYN